MASRTPEGKHVTRFIVLKKNSEDTKFVRSYNVPQFFATRELAQAAVEGIQQAAVEGIQQRYPNVQYKVRQK